MRVSKARAGVCAELVIFVLFLKKEAKNVYPFFSGSAPWLTICSAQRVITESILEPSDARP
jgi:hypothetical protein